MKYQIVLSGRFVAPYGQYGYYSQKKSMNRLIEYLYFTKRPLILLGAGARESVSDIIAFAERWQIPIETTWNAIDLVPYDHPLFIGRPGIVATRGSNWAIQACDLLLAIGTRLDQSIVAYDYASFVPEAKKIMVDIDEGEGLKIPNLDLFINKDAGEFIRELNKSKFSITPVEWLLQCAEWKQSRMEGDTVTYWLMESLCDSLPNDAILVLDSGCMAVNIFCAGFRNKAGQRVILSSCGLGTMGAALPVAIGAAVASGKQVTVISGDGSFMQNIQELEVVRRLNLPITFYIMDNGGYASIRNSEMRAFGRTSGSETIPDIQKIADAFGVSVNVVDVPYDEILSPRVMFDGRGSLSEMWPYE